jgi:hypothetical protein
MYVYITVSEKPYEAYGRAYGNDIGHTHHRCENAGSDDDAPQWKAQALFTCCILVQIPQNVEAQDDHGTSKKHEARLWREQWPITSKIGLEEAEL